MELYRILDGEPQFVSASTSQTNEEVVEHELAAGEELAIRVYGYNGAVNRRYDFWIDGPNVEADPLEPNDDFDTPTELGPDNEIIINDLSIHESENDDYFHWTAPADGSF